MKSQFSHLHYELAKNFLLKQEKYRKPSLYGKLTIFEWGCGGSTVQLSKELEAANIDYIWHCVETSRYWATAVSEKCSNKVHVHLIDYGTDEQDQLKKLCMKEYIGRPQALYFGQRAFDFMLIDGRKRVRCAQIAWEVMKPTGVVILHDADRPYYGDAYRKFLTRFYLDRTGFRMAVMNYNSME